MELHDLVAQSEGGTPDVYLFNPFTEGHLARGPSFTPTKHQAQLARDLANLPQFLCRPDDIVLVPRRPAVEFLRSLEPAGFAPPEFVESDLFLAERLRGYEPFPLTRSLGTLSPTRCTPAAVSGWGEDRGEGAGYTGGSIPSLATRRLGALRPWAWGPDSVALLAPLLGQVTAERRTAAQCFNDRLAQLYSKAWSAEFLRDFLSRRRVRLNDRAGGDQQPRRSRDARSDDASWLCGEAEVGASVDTLDAALDAVAAIRRRGHHRVVVKQALGLAGQNALRLWEPGLLEAQRRWLERALQRGCRLVIEPWLERELDFSVQLELGAEGLKLCGYTGLRNDLRGQFQANWAESLYLTCLPDRVAELLRGPPDIARRLASFYDELFAALEIELRRLGHLGPVGIDAFVYRQADGVCRLKPVVEFNPRYTMGRVTVELMKHTCPGSCGLFRLVSRAMARAEGFADFVAYANSLKERFPLRLEGQPVARLREGALCLNDPAQAQVTLAVFQVSRTLDSLLSGVALQAP